MIQPGIEPESTVSVADALFTPPLVVQPLTLINAFTLITEKHQKRIFPS